MKARFVFAAFVMSVLFAGGAAQAEEAVAVAPGNNLILFDTATPGTTTMRPVTGLGANETIRGIDYRPATGEILVCSITTASAANSVIVTYRIDHTTGVATLIGQTLVALPDAADVPTGYDVNPVIDRIRYNNTNDENVRVNPNNAALSGNDTDLNPPATTTIIAAAHDRNTPGTPGISLTTLFVIDRNDSQLGIQGGINGTPSPNGGVVTDLAPLGFNLHQALDGGFDITPGGTAYAALADAATGLTGLYTLNLPTAASATPAATFVGMIGAGSEIYSLTVLPPDTDGDGVRDPLDPCPNDAANDFDADGDCADVDNCPGTANSDQADADGDGKGDVCDNCPGTFNADQADADGDGKGDVCDNCPNTFNADQADGDGDGKGDVCDNCPAIFNVDQADADTDGVGDACEPPDACGVCAQGVLPTTLLSLAFLMWGRRRRP